MTECQELLWRNVGSYGGMSGVIADCQELLCQNVRSYYARMSGVIMAYCQDLL